MSCVLSVLDVALTITVLGCAQKETSAESEILAHFTTYTDEAGLFSISYPPDWELYLSEFEGFEQASKELIRAIMADAPLERSSPLFMAGVPTEMGWDPNVNVMVQSLLGSGWTVDKAVEGQLRALKDSVQEYQEFSRVKTIIDGRESVIVDCEVAFPGGVPGLGIARCLQMSMLVDKYCWTVSVSTGYPKEFEGLQEDFYAIVRSLRIFK